MKRPTPRTSLPSSGSYVSVPSAFDGADDAVKHVVKMNFAQQISAKSVDPLHLETTFSSDHFVVDLKAFDPSKLDPKKVIADCDLLKAALLTNPEAIRKMAEAHLSSPTGFKEAFAIANKIGLTEQSALDAGGGLLFLLAIAALVIMAGSCEHCHGSHPPH